MEQPTKLERMLAANMMAVDVLLSVAYIHWGAPKDAVLGTLREGRDKLVAGLREKGRPDDEIALVEGRFDTVMSFISQAIQISDDRPGQFLG